MSPWLSLSPVGLALAGAVLALTLDAFGRRLMAISTTTVALLAAALAAGWVAATTAAPSLVFQPANAGSFLNTTPIGIVYGRGYSGIGALVFALGALALLGGRRSLGESSNGAQGAALVAFSAAAGALLASSLDLLLTIVALEAIALTGYALVSIGRGRRSDEAAMKYFIQGAVATGIGVYALSVIYGLYGGSLLLPLLSDAFSRGVGRPALTAMALLLAAFAFKLGAFPFHSWAPDAYETAPPAVAAFLATAPKLAALAALVIIFPLFGFGEGYFSASAIALFSTLASASIVFGNLAGLKQASYARMLAYSGIAQVGYALVGVVALHAQPDSRRSIAVLVAGLAYAAAAGGAFLGVGALRAAMPGWDGRVSDLAGASRVRPVLSAALVVCMLSLTGIPLTAGFWGKFLVFGDAVASGYSWLAIVGVLGSVVSFGYYGGVIKAMYLEERPMLSPVAVGADRAAEGVPDVSAEIAVVIAALVVLALGVVPFFTDFGFLVRLLALA